MKNSVFCSFAVVVFLLLIFMVKHDPNGENKYRHIIVRKYSLHQREEVCSCGAKLLKNHQVMVFWRTDQRRFVQIYPVCAEVMAFTPDWSLAKIPGQKLEVIFVDRHILSDQEIDLLCQILDQLAGKIKNGTDYTHAEIEDFVYSKVPGLLPLFEYQPLQKERYKAV